MLICDYMYVRATPIARANVCAARMMMYVCTRILLCVCVSVRVCEREIDRDRDKQIDRQIVKHIPLLRVRMLERRVR